MERKRSLFMSCVLALVMAVLCIGCAGMGTPTPQTLNERLAVSQASVTQMRSTATMLLNAKKISSQDADNVLKQTDAAAEGIRLAIALSPTDALGAANKLQATQAVLTALQAYLMTKQ